MAVDDDRPDTQADANGLACNRCRKCKLRCSRERPACGHCRKNSVECMYETKRTKPGLKAGAVENLHRRLDALERMVRERDDRGANDSSTDSGSPSKPAVQSQNSIEHSILSLLAKELPKLIGASSSCRGESPLTPNELDTHPQKRRRVSGEKGYETHSLPKIEDVHRLPDTATLGALIAVYFSHVHHWIPMVHQSRLMRRLGNPEEQSKLAVLLHAIVISVSKYVDNDQLAGVSGDMASYKDWLVSVAIQTLSVESLQALIIIAFTDIGDGNAEKAWPVVGSLTRTVEYLQLTVEHEDHQRQPLCQPYCPVAPAEDWTEQEERRRVFWNVFCLDRLCSVTMGWNTSLTSDDVCRRLPCDGMLWRKQEPVTTPFFGIWNKSAGRIGNPIAFMPADHRSPERASPELETPSRQGGISSPVRSSTSTDAMSTMGAYAYAIEATESMSRVTSYFLQQRVNIRDHREISAWLTRFKELDLRLVHWKMLLPQKWKSNVSRETTATMDPNLTMAHVTHNASMILLHQLIAYPPRNWLFRHRIPSTCSAETCHSAAVEIATILQHFRKATPSHLPICPQYAFCIYAAARIFLIHWRYYSESRPASEFWFLVQSLEDMSQRWNGTACGSAEGPRADLASKYATRLREMHDLCINNECYRINVASYTAEIFHSDAEMVTEANVGQQSFLSPSMRTEQLCDSGEIITPSAQLQPDVDKWAAYAGREQQPISNYMPFVPPDKPLVPTNTVAARGPQIVHSDDVGISGSSEYDANGLSHALVDQSFLNVDRVISFDGGDMFAGTMDGNVW